MAGHIVAAAAVLDEAWPGTGEVYPMLRVTLLHKSDGAAAPETTQGSNGLRVSCINGAWALPCNLHVKTVILGIGKKTLFSSFFSVITLVLFDVVLVIVFATLFSQSASQRPFFIARKYSQSFQIAWGPERYGMRGINPLSLQSAVVSVPPGQTLENFSDAGRRDGIFSDSRVCQKRALGT